jgi:predicted PurR-regulated permease PerM
VTFATLFIVAVLLAFWLLYRFSDVIFVLIISIVLGTAIRPAVEWLNRRGLSRSAGVLVIYILLLSVLAGLIFLAAPLIAEQVAAISVDLPVYYQGFRDSLLDSGSRILRQIGFQLPQDLTLPAAAAPTEGEEVIDRVGQSLVYAGTVGRAILIFVAVFLLGFYWTLESDRTIRNILLWIPTSRREDLRQLIAEIESKVGGFIIGQSILCLAIGLMALVAYLLIGLPYALVLAILAGLLEAVPVFGPALGAIPALLVAVSTGPSKAIWVLIATGVIQALENSLLVPRIMKRSVGVNPFVTLLALAAFTSLLGLAGALLAVPMAAIIQLLLDRFVLQAEAPEPQTPMGRGQLSVLRYEARDLAQDIRKQFRQKSEVPDETTDQIEDSIEAIATDLDSLLTRLASQEGEQ